jgi:hypothetical protein
MEPPLVALGELGAVGAPEPIASLPVDVLPVDVLPVDVLPAEPVPIELVPVALVPVLVDGAVPFLRALFALTLADAGRRAGRGRRGCARREVRRVRGRLVARGRAQRRARCAVDIIIAVDVVVAIVAAHRGAQSERRDEKSHACHRNLLHVHVHLNQPCWSHARLHSMCRAEALFAFLARNVAGGGLRGASVGVSYCGSILVTHRDDETDPCEVSCAMPALAHLPLSRCGVLNAHDPALAVDFSFGARGARAAYGHLRGVLPRGTHVMTTAARLARGSLVRARDAGVEQAVSERAGVAHASAALTTLTRNGSRRTACRFRRRRH